MGEAESREEELKPMPTNLTISVTPDEDNGTTQTDLFCNVNHCGKLVTVVSNGAKNCATGCLPRARASNLFPRSGYLPGILESDGEQNSRDEGAAAY